MEKIKKIGAWVWNHLSNLVLLAGWILSAGFLPALLALGEGAEPVYYGIAALAGILAFSATRALWVRSRLWKVDARVRERLTSSSSAFDPMARVYEDKRLFLSDLAPAGRREVVGRKFVNCEIIGPGSAVLGTRSDESKPWPFFATNLFYDVDCIEVDPSVASYIAIYFPDCSFENCRFYFLNLLFTGRPNDTWHWITPDYRQPPLIEDKSDDET